ncbi:hypothetical protein BH10BAC2_BH10BAC2_42340 [soil metagenome]
MKKFFLILFLSCFINTVPAQINTDSLQRKFLKDILDSTSNDSTRFKLIDSIWVYIYSSPDSALKYIKQNILLSQKMNSDVALATSYAQYGALEQVNGNYPSALQYRIKSLRIAEKTKDFLLISNTYQAIGGIYKESGDFDNAITYLRKAKSFFEIHYQPKFRPGVDHNTAYTYFQILKELAQTYETFNLPDSALNYASILYNLYTNTNGKMDDPSILYTMGNIYSDMGHYSKSLQFHLQGASIADNTDIKKDLMDNYVGMAKSFKYLGQLDSSIYYANKVLDLSRVARNILVKMKALDLLAEIYKLKHNNDSVVKYLDLTVITKDSLFNQQKGMEIKSMAFSEQLRQQEIEQENVKYKIKVRNFILTGSIVVLLLIAVILYRSNRQKQKDKVKILKAYENLKITQAQLIQSEKMASLGELTAGIAHEIQNPLNFVNNFSEVNRELISELVEEVDKGNTEEVKAIANDIKVNEEKINHHGKRADAIVKGMLQHSRSSSGVKEPTDINALCDEYLRLSYHGLHAKDKDFNATMQTDFDRDLSSVEGKINIIPQDIGRVILNLIINAFYAVDEKHKSGTENYEPTVSVITKKINGHVEVIVKDNGNGIPQNIVDKIFQPFFTTKPTGQGTGLGLSLSYDIIKAHGGDLKVETKEGEGSTFIIQLPVI